MHTIDNAPDNGIFEVVLYNEKKSWVFSAYKKAMCSFDALEQAETHFSYYQTHCHINWSHEAAYACVIGGSCASWFVKHSGKWEPAQQPLEIPLPPPVGVSGKHALALAL